MAISLVAVGAKITAAITNAIIGQVNAQGLTGVVPTSVAGTGVSVGASGKVILTAASSASLNGCFTSTYTHYLVVLDFPTITGTVNVLARLRLSGTDLSTSSYLYKGVVDATVSNGTTTGFYISRNGSGVAAISENVDIWHPNEATAKRIVYNGTSINAGAPFKESGSGLNATATAYDGLTIALDGAGSITGTITVYGYNNN